MKNVLRMILISLLLLTSSCLASNKKEGSDSKIAKIDQLELQEDIQRFYARFTSRIIESYSHDEVLLQKHGLDLLKQYILYDSEALKITTSPYPVENFLDLLAFVKMNKIVIKEYWIPEVYGQRGLPILEAFEVSEKDLTTIAQKFIKQPNLKFIDDLVSEWRKENPDYIKVEKIRFSDFTKVSQIKQQKEKKSSLKGIFVDTENAVKAVDEMVLVSNRALFLAQHIPSIARLQMRLGAQEMISDTVNNIQSSTQISSELEKTRPAIHDLTFLVKDLKDLVSMMKKKTMKGVNVEKNLTQVDTILDKANYLVTSIDMGFNRMLMMIVLAVIVCAFFISLFWWGGRYLTRKRE